MGRPVTGSATATVVLTYVYPCEYRPGDNGFAQFGDSANPIGTRDRCQGFEIPAAFTLPLRSPVMRGRLGGAANWGISIEHRFEESSGVLQSGSGTKRTTSKPTISTIAKSEE